MARLLVFTEKMISIIRFHSSIADRPLAARDWLPETICGRSTLFCSNCDSLLDSISIILRTIKESFPNSKIV